LLTLSQCIRLIKRCTVQKAHSIAEEDFFARKNLDADDDYEEDDFEIAAKIAAKIAASTKLNENAPDEPDSDGINLAYLFIFLIKKI